LDEKNGFGVLAKDRTELWQFNKLSTVDPKGQNNAIEFVINFQAKNDSRSVREINGYFTQ
jgi:hypothetical protein